MDSLRIVLLVECEWERNTEAETVGCADFLRLPRERWALSCARHSGESSSSAVRLGWAFMKVMGATITDPRKTVIGGTLIRYKRK